MSLVHEVEVRTRSIERFDEVANAEQMLAQLAAEDPKVIMAMVAKLMPSNLIEEDITGIAVDSDKNQEVRRTLVNQVKDDAALTHSDIPKLVEGEVLPPDSMH